jgi:hypothetical protein
VKDGKTWLSYWEGWRAGNRSVALSGGIEMLTPFYYLSYIV